jgi:predicted nuclease of predicted toxin-antitoxin system
VLVSKDEDFLARSGAGGFQFLWLRCGNLTNRALGGWLTARWPVLEPMLQRGEPLVEAV